VRPGGLIFREWISGLLEIPKPNHAEDTFKNVISIMDWISLASGIF